MLPVSISCKIFFFIVGRDKDNDVKASKLRVLAANAYLHWEIFALVDFTIMLEKSKKKKKVEN